LLSSTVQSTQALAPQSTKTSQDHFWSTSGLWLRSKVVTLHHGTLPISTALSSTSSKLLIFSRNKKGTNLIIMLIKCMRLLTNLWLILSINNHNIFALTEHLCVFLICQYFSPGRHRSLIEVTYFMFCVWIEVWIHQINIQMFWSTQGGLFIVFYVFFCIIHLHICSRLIS